MFLYGWNGLWGAVDVVCVCRAHIHHGFFSMSREESYQQKILSVCLLCLLSTTAARRQPTTLEVHTPDLQHTPQCVCVCVCVSQADRGMLGKEIKQDGLIINGCRFTLVTEEQWYCASEMKLSCHLFHIPAAEHHAYGRGGKKEVQTNRPH